MQKIPGILTNNEEFTNRFQSLISESIEKSINDFIKVQNMLLSMITDDELEIYFNKLRKSGFESAFFIVKKLSKK